MVLELGIDLVHLVLVLGAATFFRRLRLHLDLFAEEDTVHEVLVLTLHVCKLELGVLVEDLLCLVKEPRAVGCVDEAVMEDARRFVEPEAEHINRLADNLGVALQEALEDLGQVA